MASRPRLALLDEPFSALDPPLRRAIRADLAAIHDRQGGAVVLVTHDQAEALAFGHRLVVLRDGRVEQSGAPADLYERPATAFVAAFLGDPGAALLRVAVRVGADLAHVENLVPGASWAVPRGVSWVEALAVRAGPEVDLALRPEHVEVVGPRSAVEPTDGPTVVVQVERVESLGPSSLIEARLGAHRLYARSLDRPLPAVGDRVLVRLLLSLASWYDPATGRAVGRGTPPADRHGTPSSGTLSSTGSPSGSGSQSENGPIRPSSWQPRQAARSSMEIPGQVTPRRPSDM